MGDAAVVGSDAGRTYATTGGDLYVQDDVEVDGDVHVDTTTFVVDAGDNEVGVGTAFPEAELHVAGDLKVTGAYRGELGPNNGAPFPRPAYNSGWVALGQGSTTTLTHNVGGNIDDYFVDLTFRGFNPPVGSGINNEGIGGNQLSSGNNRGGHWNKLTTNSILVNMGLDNPNSTNIRVRIWVIP